MFEKEKVFLVSAPILFESCKETDSRVSSTSLVRYDRNNYSVQCVCAGKIVQCKAYADQIVFVYNGEEVGRHNRKFTRGEVSYNWQHYLPLLARKPGALRNGSPFIDMDLPKELQEVRQRLEQQTTGTRDFAHILSYIATESLEAVVSACSQATKAGSISKDIILNILLRKKDEPEGTIVATSIVYPALEHTPVANCNLYNQLLKVGV